MKKILLSVLVLATILVSCTKETTRQVDQAFSDVAKVKPSDWKLSGDEKYHFVELSFPEIDETRYQYGAVLVYLRYSGDDNYVALPQVFNGNAFSFIHGKGFVEIDLQKANGTLAVPPTSNMDAKVVVIDASAFSLKKDKVNLNDLSAVQKAFNVK